MMALPVTTQRVAHTATYPLRLVEPDVAPSERLPARSPTLRFSCSTNLANDVTDHLRQAKLTARAWEVCAYLHRQTFGNAGWHRKRGQPETQCAFDLAAWAAAIPCDRSNLRRTLADLVACQIIWLRLDPARPGSGQVGWHLVFADWLPYDQRRQRAGRKQGSMVNSTISTTDHALLPEAALYLTTPACSEGSTQAAEAEHTTSLAQQAGVVKKPQEADGDGASNSPFDHARLVQSDGHLTMPACQGSVAEAGSPERVRKGRRKNTSETPTVVSERLCLSSESPLDASKSEETYRAPAAVAEDPSPAPVPSTDQVAYWPSRQPHERTDLDYYQRVLREREKERVALLVRLAHERIGVPRERPAMGASGRWRSSAEPRCW